MKIHPFNDGNGRTGRILNLLFLIQEQLLAMPILYLSKYIIKTKNDYYSALRKVIEKQEWEQWILYILNGVTEIADWTKDKITSIRDLLEHTCDYVQQKEPRLY